MIRDRLNAADRQMRRNTRRLKRILRYVPQHKRLVAEQLVNIATDDNDSSSLGALETLLKLMEGRELEQETHRDTALTEAIRELGGNNLTSQHLDTTNRVHTSERVGSARKTGCTPGGRASNLQNTKHIYIDSTQHQYPITERLLSKPKVIASKDSFVENVYIHFFRNRSFSLPFDFEWTTLSSSEKRKYTTALKPLYKEISDAWPKSLPEREPELEPGDVVCPACNGSRGVPRALRVALEWFLARRAKKAKLDGRERIDPGDWGYEEISAVELCDYYRNKEAPLLCMELKVGVPNLFQDQKPTRLHPTSIEVQRYPTETQLDRGNLELKEKYKKQSAVDRSRLRKMQKEKLIRGPILIENSKGLWSCDWKSRGVGCRVIHIKSGLSVSSESFNNFSQNLSSAELELESLVASWLESQKDVPRETGTQKDDLRK